MAGSCEHSNEPLGSIKCGEFLYWLSVLQEGLCSMELVTRQVLKREERLDVLNIFNYIKSKSRGKCKIFSEML
jgi:hypothetical protein